MSKNIAILVGVILLAITASAEIIEKYPDLGFKGIGVRGGPAIPDSKHNIGFAFGLSGYLGKLHKIIGLETMVEYMRVTKTELEVFTNSHSDISLIGTVKVMPELESLPFDPYLGGGVGFHYITDTPDEDMSGEGESTHKTRFELHLTVGATMPITEGLDGLFSFKLNLSDVSTYNPYLGVIFTM